MIAFSDVPHRRKPTAETVAMTEQDVRAQLMQMINGYQVSQAICAAAVLGVADHLAARARSSDELADLTNTHADALYRLLRALASIGVFAEGPDRIFTITPLGQYLRSDVDDSVVPWARQISRPYYREAWSYLPHSVRTGENAFRHTHGTGVWEYRQANPEESVTFDRAMTGLSRGIIAALLAAYDFGSFPVLMDVGGGQGTLLATILARNPGQRGILFDQPQVVAGAPALLEAAGVANRCEVVAGDFFETVPQGAHGLLLKWILHDWDDELSSRLLNVCRSAIRPTAGCWCWKVSLPHPTKVPAPSLPISTCW